MPVILTFFDTRAYNLDVGHTSNQTDSDVICSRSYDQRKIAKNDRKIILDV